MKVLDDGTVKVLDFGLATAFAADGSAASDVASSPTITAQSTQAGVILGTAAYMAPEQVRGRAVDRRADVWAFGAVLFEAGERGTSNVQMYIRRLDRDEAVPVAGVQQAVGPFFSPDNQWLGYVDQVDSSQIKKAPVAGGPPINVVKAATPTAGATWTSDGYIVYGGNGSLFEVPETGGVPAPLTTPTDGELAHIGPSAVHGTSVVLFTTGGGATHRSRPSAAPPGAPFASTSSATTRATRRAATSSTSRGRVRFTLSGSIPAR